jgi:hypothetical protein
VALFCIDLEFWPEDLKDKDAFGNLGVDGRIIFKYILEKCILRIWIHSDLAEDKKK